MNSSSFEETSVIFQDVHIHQATLLPPDSSLKLHVVLSPASGKFEVSDEGCNIIVTGHVTTGSDDDSNVNTADLIATANENAGNGEMRLSMKDVYLELHLRGYNYGPAFQVIHETNLDGVEYFCPKNSFRISLNGR